MRANHSGKILIAAAIGTLASHASAVTILNETFEGYANGNLLPASAVPAPGPGFTAISVETVAGSGNFVAIDGGGQSSFNDDAVNVKGLHLFDAEATTTAPNVRYQFAAAGSGLKVGAAPGPNFVFSADFNFGPGSPSDVPEGTNSAVNTFNAILRLDGGAGATAGPGLVIDRNEDGDIYTRTTGGNGAQIGFDLGDSTWFRAVFTVNAAANNYSVQIFNDSLTLVSTLAGSTNLAFEGNGDATPNDITEFTHVFLTDNNATGAGGDFFLDNLRIDTIVPEPASLGLVGLGASTLLRRRRE